jgi:hypothetical protein
MNGNEAAQHRALQVRNQVTGRVDTYKGDQVYSIQPIGIVVASGTIRFFYPWQVVSHFSYHNDDVAARKVIQGY